MNTNNPNGENGKVRNLKDYKEIKIVLADDVTYIDLKADGKQSDKPQFHCCQVVPEVDGKINVKALNKVKEIVKPQDTEREIGERGERG